MSFMRFVNPVPQYTNNNGAPFANGSLTFYETLTSTLKDTWSDEDGMHLNTNPVTLNSYGAPTTEIFMSGIYRVVAKSNSGAIIWDRDPVVGGAGTGTASSEVVANYAALIAFNTAQDGQLVEMQGFYNPADGGGGDFYWNAASTATPNKGFVVQATGVTTGRFIRLKQTPINVKWFGAKGDGATDDAIPIQAAIDATNPLGIQGGRFLFPQGKYITTVGLDFSALSVVVIEGDGFVNTTSGLGSEIYGSVVGDLVKWVPSSVFSSFHIQWMSLQNTSTNAAAVSIHLENFIQSSIRDCRIFGAGGYGLYAPSNTFTIVLDGVKLDGNLATYPNCVLAYFGGHASIYSCDVTGGSDGVRTIGSGIVIHGGRWEVNKRAVVIGLDNTGSGSVVNGVTIEGLSMEANDIAIYMADVGGGSIKNIRIQGSTNAPSGQSQIGILYGGASQMVTEGVSISGGWNQAGIRVSGGSFAISFKDVNVLNSFTGRDWDVQGGLGQCFFERCNYKLNADDSVTILPNAQDQLRSSYIQQVDYLNGSVRGKNLRGLNIAIGSGTASKAIAFTGTGHTSGNAAINTATAGSVAGSLAPGTYYYIATAVTSHGECSPSGEKTVTISGGNNGTTLTFFGQTQDGFKHRVYRGTVSGVYDGYYDGALNDNGNYVDTGAAFTGIKQPPTAGVDDTAMVEPDANYTVMVQTAWDNGGTWITSKATTGFTINWKTNPGSDSTLDWMIVR